MSDPKNPSGALPGDPRYGLSEEQLKQYYMTKSPSWCIRCVIDPDGGMRRREPTARRTGNICAASATSSVSRGR